MAQATGLTVIKEFPYRGAAEEYSNTYWFTEPNLAPSDDAGWRTLFDALVAVEKACYPSVVHVIRGYGYDDDSGHKPSDSGAVAPAVWSVDLKVSPNTVVPGTLATGGIELGPGDSAVWARWKTDRRTEGTARPVYLRKYFHPALGNGTDADLVATAQRTALLALGAKLSDGTFTDGRTLTTCGQDDTITGHGASTYIAYRQLRRGRRRPT